MTASTSLRPLPTVQEAATAKESGRKLSLFLQTHADTQRIDIVDDNGTSHHVQLPVTALRLLVEVLTEIGEGNAVSIIPIHAELTTQDAADVLNVSRPYVVQLMDRGELPHRKVGTHRRVYYKDVMAHKEGIDAARRKTLDELAAESQALDLETKK